MTKRPDYEDENGREYYEGPDRDDGLEGDDDLDDVDLGADQCAHGVGFDDPCELCDAEWEDSDDEDDDDDDDEDDAPGPIGDDDEDDAISSW